VPDLAAICGKVAEAGVARMIVCPMAGVLPPAKAAAWRVAKRREIARPAWGPTVLRYREVMAGHGPPTPVTIDPEGDIAVLQYTGGTTGTPKGAMLSHANLTINAMQVRRHMPSLREGAERMMGVLPFFHVFAMTSVMNCGIALGAEIQLHPRFEIGAVAKALTREKPTMLHAVPTIYAAIATHAEKHKLDISSLRACISGGAPLPAEVRTRFEKLTGAKVVEGYGLTETAPVLACNPPDGRIKDGTVGVPVEGTAIEIRALDDPHRLLPPGEQGEVCARGPQVMLGYWQRPAETADVFVDGALRTGDVGMLDEDGYLTITDRLKDVIICGGYNVYPRVVEDALYQHPAVAEAVVVGAPDAYRGQAPVAFVTLRAGQSAAPEQITAFLCDYLSKIELPREVRVRESLPKTMIGKLSRKELAAELASGELT
ncbi:MAG: AMP-binding protein, partial [Acidisphaera sp.]|nr:AMP-binding protein [Acidisphaera sp.]